MVKIFSMSLLVATSWESAYLTNRELRRQLFGRYRRRHSKSRSRSPHRHRSHEERSHKSHRRHDDRDYHESHRRKHRSISPGHRRGRSRSRSPGARKNRSPVRDGSEERRARIAQWNREREEHEHADKGNTGETNHRDNGYDHSGRENHGHQQQVQQQPSPREEGYEYWSF